MVSDEQVENDGVINQLSGKQLRSYIADLPVTPITINGQPIKVLVDTGSATSIISAKAAEKLNLKVPSGSAFRPLSQR